MSGAKFSVDEVCWGVSFPEGRVEACIVALPRDRAWRNEFGYLVRAGYYLAEILSQPGPQRTFHWSVPEGHLRKRRPPGMPEQILAIFNLPVKLGEPA